jgi:phosphatidylserine/phosphatidylglycerophosphate/cardiolipin synthase-like enzyme
MLRATPARSAAVPRNLGQIRTLADQALSRAAGAPLIGGNRVKLLRDAAENYPAWARAIIDARKTIHVEMYIIHRDEVGRRFVELLATRARAGVKVRLVYDWFGCGFAPLFGLFKPLLQAGGEVRVFNRPSLAPIVGWARRNHRKLIAVDGRLAYISGLCIGREWQGQPDRNIAPWRDTGVEIAGPAVAEAEEAFAESWRLAGGTIDEPAVTPDQIAPAGQTNLRLIATSPYAGNVLKLDLLVTAMARRTLWITDAYFIGHGLYLEALRSAARDKVDVRLLLPQGSDIGWTVPLSRTLYRSLLEAGVRIFEWNGTMVHAKTAVADRMWARVGSSNLNITSWLGNWELDVAVEDATFGEQMAAQFEQDLKQSTEIVLHRWRKRTPQPVHATVRAQRSARRVVRTVTGVGRSLGAAVTGSRPLDDFEIGPLAAVGAFLTAVALGVFWVPEVLAWSVAIVAGWTGIGFLYEAFNLWWARRR